MFGWICRNPGRRIRRPGNRIRIAKRGGQIFEILAIRLRKYVRPFKPCGGERRTLFPLELVVHPLADDARLSRILRYGPKKIHALVAEVPDFVTSGIEELFSLRPNFLG